MHNKEHDDDLLEAKWKTFQDNNPHLDLTDEQKQTFKTCILDAAWFNRNITTNQRIKKSHSESVMPEIMPHSSNSTQIQDMNPTEEPDLWGEDLHRIVIE